MEHDNQITRNKGIANQYGKIYKGTINEAPVKFKVSSIPNKHENIIFRTFSEPAFGDSSAKFAQSFYKDNTPGPGNYNAASSINKIESKKGSGFFASSSKLQTMERFRSHGPGPGSYKTIEKQRKKALSQKSSNNSTLNSSRSTAMMSSQLQSQNTPGIGTYNLNPERSFKSQSAYSAFKSKLSRFPLQNEKAPPVGLKTLSNTTSNFNLTNRPKKIDHFHNRELTEFQRQANIENALKNLEKKEEKETVGPGYYETDKSKISKTFKIKETMYDRFGELKPVYQIAKMVDSEHESQLVKEKRDPVFSPYKTMTSAFKSETKKWDIRNTNQMDPGSYNMKTNVDKKSYLVNFTHKWV